MRRNGRPPRLRVALLQAARAGGPPAGPKGPAAHRQRVGLYGAKLVPDVRDVGQGVWCVLFVLSEARIMRLTNDRPYNSREDALPDVHHRQLTRRRVRPALEELRLDILPRDAALC